STLFPYTTLFRSRCQIKTAAKPEHVVVAAVGSRVGDKQPNVHVSGGNVRIAWMQHHGHAHGLPGPAGELLAVRAGRRRQGLALYMAEQHTCALKQRAAFQVT